MQQETSAQIIHRIAADDVRIIRFLYTDIRGTVKNITLPAAGCTKAFQDGLELDGSLIDGTGTCGKTSLVLVPDPATYRTIPNSSGKTREAQCICDVMDGNNTPYPADPRGILRRVLDRTKEEGYEFFTGPEMEFWLFGAAGKRSSSPFHDNGTYFDLFPADNGVDIRREIVLTLTGMGYQIEASHHEVGRGQHEIPFRYGPALATADRIITFREVARNIARTFKATASFIAKPEAGMNGNAMHIHASLKKDGRNAFFDPRAPEKISKTAVMFIGGLLAHARGLCRIANTTINSYKRLTPGYEAPCTISWSTVNRSALIRIPAARGEGTRIELRNPDAMGNPYLLLAGMLAAGMDGVRREIIPPARIAGDAYSFPGSVRKSGGRDLDLLPQSLGEAQECLVSDRLLCDTLGVDVIEALARIAADETVSFDATVHPWEIRRYFPFS